MVPERGIRKGAPKRATTSRVSLKISVALPLGRAFGKFEDGAFTCYDGTEPEVA
jgi:hypothetical protein